MTKADDEMIYIEGGQRARGMYGASIIITKANLLYLVMAHLKPKNIDYVCDTYHSIWYQTAHFI